MRDLIGRTLGHYRIVDKIGEGGMGEVYRAHDERLDRDVAVKVLAERVAKSQERITRFEREAKAIAKLSHRHICTLDDVGREEGVVPGKALLPAGSRQFRRQLDTCELTLGLKGRLNTVFVWSRTTAIPYPEGWRKLERPSA
jgi:serine/threonine protein kinase